MVFIQLFLLIFPRLDLQTLIPVPLYSSLDEGIVLQVKLLELLWGWSHNVLLSEPADEVRVLMELVGIKPLVEDNASCW